MISNTLKIFGTTGNYSKHLSCIPELYNYSKTHIIYPDIYPDPDTDQITIKEYVIIKDRIFILKNNGICYCIERDTGFLIKKINDHTYPIFSLSINEKKNDLIISCINSIVGTGLLLYKLHYNFDKTQDINNMFERICGKDSIKWPGFYEIDSNNNVILTFNIKTEKATIWNLDDYKVVNYIDLNHITNISIVNVSINNILYIIIYSEDDNKHKINIISNNFTLVNTIYVNARTSIKNPNPISDFVIDNQPTVTDITSCECCGCKGLSFKQFKKRHKGKGTTHDWKEGGRLNKAYHLQKKLKICKRSRLQTNKLIEYVCEKDLTKLSFIEQLNNYLFIKYQNIDLIILDIMTNKFKSIEMSSNCDPSSFCFLSNHNKFLYVHPDTRNVALYFSNGNKICDFEDHIIHSNNKANINQICLNKSQDIVISLCDSKINKVTLNISHTHTGKLIKRIILSDIGINYQTLNIETITYEEEKNEIFLSTYNEIIVLKI